MLIFIVFSVTSFPMYVKFSNEAFIYNLPSKNRWRLRRQIEQHRKNFIRVSNKSLPSKALWCFWKGLKVCLMFPQLCIQLIYSNYWTFRPFSQSNNISKTSSKFCLLLNISDRGRLIFLHFWLFISKTSMCTFELSLFSISWNC